MLCIKKRKQTAPHIHPNDDIISSCLTLAKGVLAFKLDLMQPCSPDILNLHHVSRMNSTGRSAIQHFSVVAFPHGHEKRIQEALWFLRTFHLASQVKKV